MPNDEAIPSYLVPLAGFRSRKAAQVCAYFSLKDDGIIEKLKLIKLIYFAEREFLTTYEASMLLDELYSLPHGPICSSTLNGINGMIHSDIWEHFIVKNGNRSVAVRKFARDDFDELNDAEVACLDTVWNSKGWMSASQLRNFSHENCPEYTETDSRVPISYADLLKAVGDDRAEEVEEEIKMLRRAEAILGL